MSTTTADGRLIHPGERKLQIVEKKDLVNHVSTLAASKAHAVDGVRALSSKVHGLRIRPFVPRPVAAVHLGKPPRDKYGREGCPSHPGIADEGRRTGHVPAGPAKTTNER